MYDIKQQKKLKVAEAIEFPHEINFHQWLSNEPVGEKSNAFDVIDPLLKTADNNDAENSYQLVAVLLHLGTTAFGGHYIAHIKSR